MKKIVLILMMCLVLAFSTACDLESVDINEELETEYPAETTDTSFLDKLRGENEEDEEGKIEETTIIVETTVVSETTVIFETTYAPETTVVIETTYTPETTFVPETTEAVTDRVVPYNENYHGHVYTGGQYSKKYHYEAHCAGKNSHEITWEEVDRRGLEPCGTCVLK